MTSFWKKRTHENNVAFLENKLSTLQPPNCTLSELQKLGKQRLRSVEMGPEIGLSVI